MKILVCGGAGFIGQPLVRALVAEGHEVTATLHSKDPQPVEGVKYTEADLAARGCWRTAIECAEPELIYMAAGKTGGSGLVPLHFVTDNAVMHLHLFRAAREFGVRRVIAMSSTTGYPESFLPMREQDYFHGEPHAAYFNPGHTRRFIERLASMYPELETVFVRCAGAYGPGDDFEPRSSHVIAATVRKVAERQDPLTVWGDGKAVREGTYIDDLVRALTLCMNAPAGAYNVGPGHALSVKQMLGILLGHAGHDPIIRHDLSKPAMLAARRLDATKARKVLNWSAAVSMEVGLCNTLDWYASR